MLFNKGLRAALAIVLSAQMAFGNIVPAMAAEAGVGQPNSGNQIGVTVEDPYKPTLNQNWEVENVNEHLSITDDVENPVFSVTTEKGAIGGDALQNVLYYGLDNSLKEYEFTVKVEGDFKANSQSAYLMMTSDKNLENVVAVSAGNYSSGSSLLMGMQQKGSPSAFYGAPVSGLGDSFYLKLKKIGNDITGYYAKDNTDTTDWTQITDTNNNIDKLVKPELNVEKGRKIFLALGASNSSGQEKTNVRFSEVKINGYSVPNTSESFANLKFKQLEFPKKETISVNEAKVLAPKAFNSDRTIEYKDTLNVTYTSDNERVAKVSMNGKDAIVTGVKAGTANVTATATVGGIEEKATCRIQVGDKAVSEVWKLASPNGTVEMEVFLKDGKLQYTTKRRNESGNWVTNIPESPIGLYTSLGNFSENLVFKSEQPENEINETYDMYSGKKEKYTNHCKEKVVTFTLNDGSTEEIDLVMRAYDDAAAFRYRVRTTGNNKELQIYSESTQLKLPSQADVYWMPYEKTYKDDKGEDKIEMNYEGDYVKSKAENMAITTEENKDNAPVMPLLYSTDREDTWTLFTEADLKGSYCGSMLAVESMGTLGMRFAKAQGTNPVRTTISSQAPFESPWRVAITGTLETIVENTVVENLNPKADDAKYHFEEWVDPGLASWSWVTNWGNGISDQSKAETHKKWIDLSHEMGWEYYILDENWMKNPRVENKTTDSIKNDYYDWIGEVIQYANNKNVKLCVWLCSNTLKNAEYRQALFEDLHDKGIKGIKVDFFDKEDQATIQFYEELYKDAATYRLMVNCHGANKPTGEIRTYPNVMSREAIKGQEFGGITAEQYTILPFTRGAIGPADVTEELRSKDYDKTTMGFQIALTALMENGIHSLGSAPDVYLGNSPALSYYKEYPDHWDQTEYVDSEIGSYVNIARRNGKNWYVSGISVNARTMEVPLKFLEPDQQYIAMIYAEDGRRAIKNSMDASNIVTANSTLNIPVLAGGGYAVRLIPRAVLSDGQKVTEIKIKPTSYEIEEGYYISPEIEVCPSDAEFKEVVWESADEDIATVSATGTITAKQAGTTTITVASAWDSTVNNKIKVTVTPAQRVIDQSNWRILKRNSNIKINQDNSVTIKTEYGVLGDTTATYHNLFGIDVPDDTKDFEVTAKISGGLQADYQGGFLVVFDANNPNKNHVAAGRRHHSYIMSNHPAAFCMMGMSGEMKNVDEFYCQDSEAGKDAYVKLTKTGNIYKSYYSYDGKNWTAITNNGREQNMEQSELAAAQDLCVGFYAGSGGSDISVDVTFSQFTFNNKEVQIALPIYEICNKLKELEIAMAEAEKNLQTAEQQAREANAKAVAANTAADDAEAKADDANKKAQEAAAAAEAAKTAQQEAELKAQTSDTAKAEAQAKAVLAAQAEAEAKKAAEEAQIAQQEAIEAREIAEQAQSEAEQKAQVAVDARMEAEAKAELANKAKAEAEQKAQTAEGKVETAEQAQAEAEQKVADAEQKVADAELARDQAEANAILAKIGQMTAQIKEAEQKRKAEEAAQKVIEAEAKIMASAVAPVDTEKKEIIDVSVGDVCLAENLVYRVTDAEKLTVSLCGTMKTDLTRLVVPDSITLKGKSYKVTEIEAKAFANNKSIKQLEIGANVEKIGAKAFAKATKLKKIRITSALLKTVEKGAFKKIHKKTKVKVPAASVKAYKKLLKGCKVVAEKIKEQEVNVNVHVQASEQVQANEQAQANKQSQTDGKVKKEKVKKK